MKEEEKAKRKRSWKIMIFIPEANAQEPAHQNLTHQTSSQESEANFQISFTLGKSYLAISTVL